MGGLTLSMEGYGNDFFLFWIVNCLNFEGNQSPFAFTSSSTVKQQNSVDLCKLRFNSSTIVKLYALNQIEQPPGLELYSSGRCLIILSMCDSNTNKRNKTNFLDNRSAVEFNITSTLKDEAKEYFKTHPQRKASIKQNINEDSYQPYYMESSSLQPKPIIPNLIRQQNKNNLLNPVSVF